jgi:hypothetical protein
MGSMRDQLKGALGLAAILAALLCAGCGSSSTPSTSTSSQASQSASTANKTQFVAQAERICSTLSQQEKPLKARQETLKRLPAGVAAKTFAALVHQVIAFSRAAASKLEMLPRPAGDTDAIKKLLSGFAGETSDAAAIGNAAASQEASTAEAVQYALRRTIADNRALAAEYGMADCIGSE